MESDWPHRSEHAALFGTALPFWRALRVDRSGRRFGPALATLTHGGFLGARITLALVPLYTSARSSGA